MAQLTDQLNSVNSGKPIVNPGPANPSVLELVGNIGSGLTPAVVDFGRGQERRRAENAQARQEAALDELASGVFGQRRRMQQEIDLAVSAPTPEWIGATDAAFTVPDDIKSAADNIIRNQRAVQQGRASQAALDMRIENFVSELFQKYPESTFELSQAMQQLGINHYLFRDEVQRRAISDAASEAQIGALTTQFDIAAKAGLVTNNTSFEAGAEIGRRWLAEQQRIETANARAQAAREDRRLSIEEREAAQREAATETGGALINQAAIAVSPLIDNVALAIAGAGTDAERQTILGESRSAIRAAIVSYRSKGIAQITANGGSAADVKVFTDYMDSQEQALEALFTTSFEQNVAANRNLSAALSIDMARAAPIYARMSALLGAPAANAVINGLDGVPGLDPEMLEAAKAEIRNFDPTSPRGTMSLARAISYLRGETPLQDLTGEEAQRYLRTNVTAMLANQREVLGGNEGAVRPWMTTYGNTVEAVIETAPAAANMESLWRASGMFATPEARRALDVAMRTDPEFADALAQASRAAAAHAINTARDITTSDAGPFSTQFNAQLGRFEAVLTRESYDEWARRQETSSRFIGTGMEVRSRGGGIPTYEEMRRRIPEGINQELTVLNRSLAHLLETDKYDEAIPSNISRRERARMYATGTPPESMRGNPSNGSAPTQRSEWDRLMENVNSQTRQLLTGSVAAPTPRRPQAERIMNYEARAVGFNELPATVRTLGDFSEFAREVNRAGADSSAAGTYQITGQTLRGRNGQNGYAEKVFGENWRSVPWTAESQDRIAEAIFNDHNHSAEALRGQWVSLSLEEAERVRKLPWSQARTIIARGESG